MLAPSPLVAHAQVNQTNRLQAYDGATAVNAGGRVAISGGTVVAGTFNGSGAYVFDANTGQQRFKLTDSEATAASFGTNVAISGNSVLLGDGQGTVRQYDATTGQLIRRLQGIGSTSGDIFGREIAITQNTVIIGAQGDGDYGTYSGAVYLFDAATGQQRFKLHASDAAMYSSFGASVSLSGNLAAIGTDSVSNTVYLFDTTTGQELRRLQASDSLSNSRFGYSVSLSGNLALVGALRGTTGGGAAYLFDVTTGEQLFKFSATDRVGTERFGESVTLTDQYAIIGAPQHDHTGTHPQQGATYIFSLATGQQVAEIVGSDTTTDDHFGQSVAASGSTLVVGSPRHNPINGSGGAAYTFALGAPVIVPEANTAALLGFALPMLGVVVVARRRIKNA